jgi:hypothetical protein
VGADLVSRKTKKLKMNSTVQFLKMGDDFLLFFSLQGELRGQ